MADGRHPLKLALAGDSYADRSVAAAAQTCINLYREAVENPDGSGKSLKILRGTPGYRLVADLTALHGNIRGVWSCDSPTGGGRCFVVAGTQFCEINLAGAIVYGPFDLGMQDADPVQMMGNGNQLGIVNAGQFFIDNGAGPRKARFQLKGIVSIAGAAVTWVSGAPFPTYAPGTADPLPTAIYINDSPLAVTFNSATGATLAVGIAGGTGTVQRNGSFLFYMSGTVFSPSWVGMSITVAGVVYTVGSVDSPYTMTTVEPLPGGAIENNLAYSVTLGNNLYSTAGGALVGAVTGAYMDGTFYAQQKSGGTPDQGRQVNFSAISDGTSWSGLDFFSKDAYPDYLQSIFADRGQLYLFGKESSEVWQNDLNTGRPVRLTGAVAREGSLARLAPVSMNEHIYFLGGAPGGQAVAYRLDGYTPTRISTHAIEEQWAKMTGAYISQAVGWWYLEDGHYFWVITFFGGPSAWVYDATERSWHERAGWDGTMFGSYLLYTHTYLEGWGMGMHVVGDIGSSKIYRMSSDLYDADGVDMKRVRALPYIYNEDKRVFVDRVQLAMDTGEIAAGTVEPIVELEWSGDNGHTFSAPQDAGFGLPGDYNRRVYWIAQGSFETAAIPRISVTGQTAVTLIDATAEVSFGTT